MKVLLISTCKEKMHDFEFVYPIKKILERKEINYGILRYNDKNLPKKVKSYAKIIICGTSLKDNDFLNFLGNFFWLRESDKDILGICSGMQLIGLVFGGKLKKKTEIGMLKENFANEFFSIKGERDFWYLHNNYVSFNEEWIAFCSSKGIKKAVKHKTKRIYGCLFHPEVRNIEIIEKFLERN